MKTKILLFSLIVISSFHSMAQMTSYIDSAETFMAKPVVSGWMWWIQPNPFSEPGQCFQYYETTTGDTLNGATFVKQWIDPQLNMTHYKFNQTYKDLRVEGAHIVEHFDSDSALILTNAKLAIELDLNTQPALTVAQAKSTLLDSIDQNWTLAWQDQSWEAAIKHDADDPSATWEPEGELMLALDNYRDLGYYIAGERYRLAYEFDVRVASPNNLIRYWVDANTGEVFKSHSLFDHDGLADVINSPGGVQTIDTRWRGFPNNDYVLETNNDEVRIHCKKFTANPFPWRAEIDKDSEPWVGFESAATTAYWYTRRSWMFYKEVYSRSGMDDDNGRIRLHVDHSSNNGTQTVYFLGSFGINNIQVDSYEGVKMGNYHDVVSHEFSHGIVKHTAELLPSDEPGALNESFCDIFGILAERYTLNGEIETNVNWEYGHTDIISRSLSDPKSDGRHAIDGCTDLAEGQPDTYLGEFWTTDACPALNGDKHAKGGVQNYWFYLLSEGGWGTNDNEDIYSVSAIGETKAAMILYWNMTNEMVSSSEYFDAREGTIAAAELLYGFCSFEYNQVMNAWHAVGVGEASDCFNASTDSNEGLSKFTVYPNPVEDQFSISWSKVSNFNLRVYNMSGQLLMTVKDVQNNQIIRPVYITKGVYIIEVSDGKETLRKKIIKQ